MIVNELDAAAFSLRTVTRLLIRRTFVAAGAKDPSSAEESAMAWLDEKGGLTASALASLEKVRPQTMAQTLESLKKRRWILRAPNVNDHRQIVISLSHSGKKALVRARKMRQTWIKEKLGSLSGRERQTVFEAIEILARMVGK